MRPLLLASLLALSGCAALRPAPEIVKMTPPVDLLQDCPVPISALLTNADLGQYALDLQTALKGCNIDKAALRAWSEGKQ